MKENLNKHWGLKVLSLLCGFFVWLGVVNVADPKITRTVEVPVEIINDEVLTENNLTYDIVGKKTTTVSFDVKTTNAHRIRPTDFRAVADMTELWSVTGSIPIRIEILNHMEYFETAPVAKTSTIKIKTEPLQKKRFDLKITYTGKLEEGYEIGETVLLPGYVFVEGPESQIGQISSVGVEIGLDGISADVNGIAEIMYYDANGNKISVSDKIQCNQSDINYQMSIMKVKVLSLDFRVSGSAADGYRYTGIDCDVKTIPVVGTKSVLASMNTLTIPADYLKLDNAKENIVKEINLEELLPDHVTIAGNNPHKVEVTLNVEALKTQNYSVSTKNLVLEGAKSDLGYVPSSQFIVFEIRGLREELNDLSIESSDVTVDVSDLKEGIHHVTPEVNLEDGFELVHVPVLELQVYDMEEGPGSLTEPDPENTQEPEEESEAQSTPR